MARRIYYKSKVKQQALEQLRKTRAKINADHPDLLESVRRQISSPPEIKNSEAIDKKKNLEIVKAFLEIAPQSKAFQAEIKKVLHQEAP